MYGGVLPLYMSVYQMLSVPEEARGWSESLEPELQKGRESPGHGSFDHEQPL